MTVELKNERRNDRDRLIDTELDRVVAGAEKYNRMMELMSKVISMAGETKKAIIANIR